MTDITIKVNGIDCLACVERLERALCALAGVCRVSASYSTGTAALSFDEAKSMCAIASRARRLSLVQPKTARVINDEKEVYITQLRADDIVLVSAGERVPVDGTITDGECMLDASVLTGDKTPAKLAPGGEVFAGTLVRAGSITVCTRRFGEDTELCRRIDALSHPKLPRNVQKLASALGITALLSVRNKEGSAWIYPLPSLRSAA